MAARRVAHVDYIAQSVGGMVDATVVESQAIGYWLLAVGQTALRCCGLHNLVRRRGRLRSTAECWRLRSHSQFFEQWILSSGDEADLQPAEDVVHDRLGDWDLLVAGEARGLEARVLELVAQKLQGHAVLKGQGDS